MSDKDIELMAKAMTVPRLKSKLNEYRIAIDDEDRKDDLVRKFVVYHATHRPHPTGSQSPAAGQPSTGTISPAAGQPSTGTISPAAGQPSTGTISPAAAQPTTGTISPAAAQPTTGALSLADVKRVADELQTYGLSALDMIVRFPSNDPNRGTKMLEELQHRKAAHTLCIKVMAVTGVLCIVFANNLYSANAENAIDTLDQNVSFVRFFSQCMTYLFTLASVASCCQSYCTWHNKTFFLVPILVIVFTLSMNT